MNELAVIITTTYKSTKNIGLDDDQINAITQLREISTLLCDNKISLADFFKKTEFELGSSFDFGDDFTKDDLPDTFSNEIKDEIMFYFKYTTYDPDDKDCEIPTDPKWEYAKSKEPFGWVDEEAYRKIFKINFDKLCNGAKE